MRGRVLLCSEAGRGRGHGARLHEIGRRLADRGFNPVYAVRSGGGSAGMLGRCGKTVVAAPQWRRSVEAQPASSATLADMLWHAGLSSPSGVRNQITRWHLVFSEFAPRILITDFAPGAVLAARGRVPVLVTGNGFFAPPAHLDRFPPLHDVSPQRTDQDALCAGINSALARTGARPLKSLPGMFAGDLQCPVSFTELDPYAPVRASPALAPELRIDLVKGARDTLFVYFWCGDNDAETRIMCDALAGLPMPRRVFAPGISPGDARTLAGAGCIVETAPLPLPEIAASTKLIVHRGGAGLSSAMLVAGVPQLIAASDIEKALNGAGVERCGGGRLVRLWESESRDLRMAIAQAWDDGDLHRRTQDLAPDFARRADNRTFDEIADAAAALTG